MKMITLIVLLVLSFSSLAFWGSNYKSDLGIGKNISDFKAVTKTQHTQK